MCFSCGFFFFKQKTAYEMVGSDWSSDVCSSDLTPRTKRIVDEISGIISRACSDRQIAELLNVLVSVNDDEDLSDFQCELGGRLFERLTQLRPECVEAAATMTSP